MTFLQAIYRRTLASALLFFAVPCSLAFGQNQSAPPTGVTKVYHLANVGSQAEANEVVTALRNTLDPNNRIFLLASTNDIVITASPGEMAKVNQLISELDKAKHAYRLTYTLAESDGGKRIGIRHLSMVVLLGQRIQLKQGDKIPVATGSYSTEKSAQETQFTYIDIGTNLDSTLDQFGNGLRLRSKVEQSSVAPERQTIANVEEPIVRQSVLEGTSIIVPGKSVNLGGIDVVGSTRHIDVEVVAEQIS